MTAAWAAAAVAIAAMALSLGGQLLARGRRDGKIDAILDELTKARLDHEQRIRALEDPWQPRRRHAR